MSNRFVMGMLGNNSALIREIGNLKLWLDASRLTGLSDSDPIAQWDDLSGNSYHAGSSGDFNADGVHPNDAGHVKVADSAEATLGI